VIKELRRKLLVVEDNPGDAEIIRILVQDEFQPVVAETLHEARQLLKNSAFDVILLDMGLPDSDGLETVIHIRTTAPQLPLVVFTGLDDKETGLQAIRCGAQDYIVKHEAMKSRVLSKILQYAIERQEFVTTSRKQLDNIRIKAKLLENVADAAIAVDLEGKIIYWNKAAEALYKFKAAEAMGRTIASLNISTPNPDSSLTDLAESQPLDGEMEMCDKSGRQFTVWMTNSLVPDDAGGVLANLSICRDISLERINKRLLEASEEKFRKIFEFSPVGYSLSECQSGIYLDANQSMLDLIGYSKNEFVKMSFRDITPAKYNKKDELAALEMKEHGYFDPYQKEYIRKDGTIVSVIVSGFKFTHIDGQNLFWTIVLDVSELEARTNDLRETEERFKTYIEDASDVVYTAETNGNFSWFSPNVEQLTGHSAGSLIGKNCRDLVHQDDQANLIATLSTARLHMGESQSANFRTRQKDDTFIWTQASVLVRKSDKSKYVIGIIRNIDKERKSELQVLDQNKRLKEIAFIQSHILRRPLSNILGVLSLRIFTENQSVEAARFYEILQSEANVMDKIILEIVEKTAMIEKDTNLEYVTESIENLKNGA